MAGEFGDSPGKKVVREQWNTPFLRHLHETYGFKFRYFGLPGADCIDVELWRDMISEVIAFEVDARGPDPRKYVLELREKLRLLQLPFVAYYAPFEFVVEYGRDWENQEYKPDKFITLYNLDFCNKIDSKIRTREASAEVYRFQAIRRVLLDQAECFRRSRSASWFVIMLTIRNQMGAIDLSALLTEGLMADTAEYVRSCEVVSAVPTAGEVKGTHTWALKALLHNTLRGYFSGPHLSALFFPVVKYTGRTEASPMFHWMLFCQFDRPSRATARYLPAAFLAEASSLRAAPREGLVLEPEPGESGSLSSTSPVEWFTRHAADFALAPISVDAPRRR